MKARGERLIDETKASEAERQMEREKRDHQQARALLLVLHELQRTVVLLITARGYNDRFCLLIRLLEEVLLHVLNFLSDNPVSLQCL